MNDFTIDWDREARTGLPEAVLCEGKTVGDIAAILDAAGGKRMLLTRMSEAQRAALTHELDYCPRSKTAFWGTALAPSAAEVAVVAAGTSDRPVALEAARTLAFHGAGATVVADVGVAGLWRLMARLDEIRSHTVIIAVAGMEGALFSVLSGLVRAPVIAVPSPVGYGVSANGTAALHSALASCAPGVVTVNIGNGYGAACAALRILGIRSA